MSIIEEYGRRYLDLQKRKIIAPKVGSKEKIYNERLHNLYPSQTYGCSYKGGNDGHCKGKAVPVQGMKASRSISNSALVGMELLFS